MNASNRVYVLNVIFSILLVDVLTSITSEVTTIDPSESLVGPGTRPPQTPDPMYTESLDEHNSSLFHMCSILSPTIWMALFLWSAFVVTNRPSKNAFKPRKAVAVITPSGAAPMPINKSVEELLSAESRAAVISHLQLVKLLHPWFVFLI